MRWWRKVRRANLTQEQRDQFELLGEDVLAHAVGAGEHSSKGADLDKLLREKRQEILEWLQERRDSSERRDDQSETIKLAILIFVILGVIVELSVLLVNVLLLLVGRSA